MIFRRVKAHIENENWFAVFIDFLIVVVGVFIGIQVANWNERLGDQNEYQLAIERLHDETLANLDVLEKVEKETGYKLDKVRTAIEALRSCEHTDENVDLIEQGIQRITGTTTIHIKMTALEELTSTPELLAQQSRSIRNQLLETKFDLKVLKIEANFAESLPFRDRPETNPQITVGKPEAFTFEYHGITLSNTGYPLKLAGRVDEACADGQIIKSLYTWLKSQGNIPAYSAAMRSELSKLLEITGPITEGRAP